MATVSKFKVGDIVTTDDELFYKILAVTKYGYVTSEGEFEYETAKKSEVADSELILNESEHDYHTTDGVREYTLEEIANELGVGVRSIRIKD